MNKNRKTLQIEISNLTEDQADAIEDMMAYWQWYGALGCSRWTAFFADGDGNFRPEVLVNGKKAEPVAEKYFEPIDRSWYVAPKNRPLTEEGKVSMSSDYAIDFDWVSIRKRAHELKK